MPPETAQQRRGLWRPCGRPTRLAQSPNRARKTSHERKMSSSNDDRGRPRDLLPVGLPVIKTAMQDADEAVCERPQGLVMALAPAPELVIVAPRTGRMGDGAEGPPKAGIRQPSVAGDSRQHRSSSARHLGDGR